VWLCCSRTASARRIRDAGDVLVRRILDGSVCVVITKVTEPIRALTVTRSYKARKLVEYSL
jgi:hypothetical protein